MEDKAIEIVDDILDYLRRYKFLENDFSLDNRVELVWMTQENLEQPTEPQV